MVFCLSLLFCTYLHRSPPRGILCFDSCLRELAPTLDHFLPIVIERVRSSIASTVAAKSRARRQEHRTLRVVSPTLEVKSRLHLGATTSPRSLQQLIQGAWSRKVSRLGMVSRLGNLIHPRTTHDVSQLVPPGHLCHHNQNLGTPGLSGFACQYGRGGVSPNRPPGR